MTARNLLVRAGADSWLSDSYSDWSVFEKGPLQDVPTGEMFFTRSHVSIR